MILPDHGQQPRERSLAVVLLALVVAVVGLSLVGPVTATQSPTPGWGGPSAGQSAAAVGAPGAVATSHGDIGLVVRCEPSTVETEATGMTVCGTVVAVTNNTGPSADFTYEPSEPAPGETVRFAADASDVDGNIVEYDWRVNGETISVYSGFEYSFAGAGEYVVELTVTDDDGATDTVRKTVTVTESTGNQPPTATFSVTPQEPTVGQETTFVADAADPDGEVVEYSWQIDGRRVTGGSEFTVTFTEAGEHVVRLTATDNDGATASTSRTITVTESGGNQPPTATISAPTTEPALDEEITLTAAASDPDGEVVEYAWAVNGEQVSDGPEFDVSFADTGEYLVELTATDDDGATVTASRTIIVAGTANEQPTVTIPRAPPTPAPDEPVSFTAEASDPDGEVASYLWQVDGERVGESPTLEYAFPGPGEYTITVTVTDDAGATATASTTATVKNEEPADEGGVEVTAAWWHTPLRPQVGETVTLSAEGVAGQGVSYRWDLDGDGNSEKRGALVSNTFSASGERTITLRAVGPDGTTETRTATVAVQTVSGAVAGGGSDDLTLWMSPLNPLPGERVTLVAAGSSRSDASYRWEFGDGTEKRGRMVNHVFTDSSTTVTLRRVLADGQVTTASSTVATRDAASIGPSDDRGPSLWVTPLRPRPGQAMTFVAEPAAPLSDVAEYRWDFDGDGEPDARGRSVTQTASASGEFGVTLVVERTNGTTATIEESVIVAGNVTAEPTDKTATPPPEDTPDTGSQGTDGDTGTVGIGTPGFGPVAMLVALALILLLSRQWPG